MRTLCVIVDPPFFDDFSGLTNAGEPVLVQAFLAVSSVETFDIGVLGRFAGVDEIELDAVIISPSIQRAPAQFRAVINDQDIGVSSQHGTGRDADGREQYAPHPCGGAFLIYSRNSRT